ncbi:aspartyl beta-hydroxylase [bacterium]|nr:aspartyl beta-hydroxylase [bacterium]
MSDVETLAAAADQAARTSRWDEAERLWEQVLALAPRDGRALFSLSMHALQRNDLAGARAKLIAAREVAPSDLRVLHALGVVLGRMGEAEAELEAIQSALAVDPYFLPGMLSKGGWLERNSTRSAAATMFRHCLKVAPPQAHWPESLRPQLEHAKAFVDAWAGEFSQHLDAAMGPHLSRLDGPQRERWREAASIMAGRTRPYVQEANQLAVPRLPAIPFHERSQFPWAAKLEAQTDAIHAELERALQEQADAFSPYIAYRPGDPVNQWRELNHSNRWSHLSLWRGGVPDQDNLAACPVTAAALQQVDMATIGGLCPNAMFSALAPHTEIPPHHGETNARLVVHLPLIVPSGCTYRVGFEDRRWSVGEILVFDDTIEHTARNDGDELRVVLIFDIWNPLLSLEERAVVSAMAAAARSFT